jgi:hypothetical protein
VLSVYSLQVQEEYARMIELTPDELANLRTVADATLNAIDRWQRGEISTIEMDMHDNIYRANLTPETALAVLDMLDRANLHGFGHGADCHLCGRPCNSLAGNPADWPVIYPVIEGVVHYSHEGCFLDLIAERDAEIARLREAARLALEILGEKHGNRMHQAAAAMAALGSAK